MDTDLQKAISAAIEMLNKALISSHKEPTRQEWEEFGRACKSAIDDNYHINGVCEQKSPNTQWRPTALRLWNASKRVGM